MIASVLLFGVAANCDNLTVGAAYGVGKRAIPWTHNLIIAVLTTAVTLLALSLGREIRELIPSKTTDVIGGALLIFLAVYGLVQERHRSTARTSETRRWTSHPISLAETLYLSATLSINNIGLAIAGGIGGIGYGPAMLSIFGFSVFMLALGQALGDRMEDVLPIRPKLSNEMLGSAVLFVAGALMIAGF